MLRWLRDIRDRLTIWQEAIEDRGAEEGQGAEEAQRALREAQERNERVRGIKAEVRIVQRKYR